MIAVVDYGSGNINAISNIYHRAKVTYHIARSPQDLDHATRVILPGVGSFGQAMEELNRSGMRAALDRWVAEDRGPLLGICVGMQLLADDSEESGGVGGLGWVPGRVARFEHGRFRGATHLPHMGWNTTRPQVEDALFSGVDLESGFYFLHSYYFSPAHPAHCLATTDYGGSFASAVRKGRVYGVQFHPEKSHEAGMMLLENFAAHPF